MKAILYNKKHPNHKLAVSEVEKPVPKKNEVLIKVVATSPNAADYRAMKMGMIPKTKIFGTAVAGIVEGVGDGISQFKLGDKVIADLSDVGFGGFAEFTVAPEKVLVDKPDRLSFEEASTLPVAATTALQALVNKGKLQKEQKVLIIGSGGGVGTFAVQIAKHLGAEVTAVCSTKNLEQSKSLGADYVIDYTKEDITKNINSYNLVIAVNGNYPLIAFKRMLKEGGKYVVVGGSLSQVFKALLFGRILSVGSKKVCTLSAKANQQDLQYVAQLVEEGHIKPIIEKQYALQDTPIAMTRLMEGHAKGKLVINVR